MKTVYTCFCTDVIHDGHLNIIEKAKEHGRVVVGALTDEALIKYNRFPTASLEERIKLYKELEGVDEVVVQNDFMYNDVIASIKPDYVIHGDNWKNGPESAIREHVAELLKEYGGEVPADFDALLSLPGVGRKTANVVLSVAFGENRMAVDTHVFRVANRIGLTHDSKTPLHTEQTLVRHIPEHLLGRAHHWLILHGRYICTARKPKCDRCGIARYCRYFANVSAAPGV